MSLRTDLCKIQENSNFSTDEKSLMILLYLEYNVQLGLAGNGWLDDDYQALEVVNGDNGGLLEKMQEIINS